MPLVFCTISDRVVGAMIDLSIANFVIIITFEGVFHDQIAFSLKYSKFKVYAER